MKKFRHILLVFFVCKLTSGCQSPTNSSVLFEEAGKRIGIHGPIILKWKNPLFINQITNKIAISPDVEFNLSIDGNSLEIRPKSLFLPDQDYQLSLIFNDSENSATRYQTKISWRFKTHPECLLYIAPVTNSPEIWRFCFDDQTRTQLTHTEGRVLGFNPSPDGKWVAYSLLNENGGSDIWLMDRDGKSPKRIVQCEIDSCSDVRFVGDEKTIAFVKTPVNTNSVNKKRGIEIYFFDVSGQKTSIFNTNERINPILQDMVYGKNKLTIFERISSSIWIYDFDKGTTITLPSGEGLGGSWNRTNGNFTYARMINWGGIPYGEVNQYDPSSSAIVSFLIGREELNEFFFPQWRPQDDWLAVAYRPIDGSASKQITLISQDKKQRINVTQDQTYSYGLFSWSFGGEMIAYQRLQLGASNALPEIGLWRMEDRSHFILDVNASSPQWIP